METGVNARAIDFAKFGQLFLNGGTWDGQQVISHAWAVESTQPYLPSDYLAYYPADWFSGLPEQGYYQYMWWGIAVEPGSYDFVAAGDRGQFIYVSPRNELVIVRNGIDYGISFNAWLDLFYRFTSNF
jgi:CubicO group peptidase (beta-lactamase class C family)